MEQRELDWIVIGAKDAKDYLYASSRAFQNFEVIHLAAGGRNNITMDPVVALVLTTAAEKEKKKTERTKGTNNKDDYYPTTVITIKRRGNTPKEG